MDLLCDSVQFRRWPARLLTGVPPVVLVLPPQQRSGPNEAGARAPSDIYLAKRISDVERAHFLR